MSNNPSFQHRHYAKVAAVIRKRRSMYLNINAPRAAQELVDLQRDFADLFASDNPRFDHARFGRACDPDLKMHGKDFLTANGHYQRDVA